MKKFAIAASALILVSCSPVEADEWVAGAWAPVGACESGEGLILSPDHSYSDEFSSGKWEFNGNILTETRDYPEEEGGEYGPLKHDSFPDMAKVNDDSFIFLYKDGTKEEYERCMTAEEVRIQTQENERLEKEYSNQ